MTQSKKIAVTGGIGSGKSALLKIFRDMGYPVFSCDEINAELFRDISFQNALCALFPDCAINGEIDKRRLAAKVFQDEAASKKLNEFSHPRIMERLLQKIQSEPVSFTEVPLLYEGGYETQFDGVIALVRKKEARLSAVALRDGLTETEIRARMARQLGEKELLKKDCILIQNDKDEEALKAEAKKALDLLGLS